jgi:hypothetical protein
MVANKTKSIDNEIVVDGGDRETNVMCMFRTRNSKRLILKPATQHTMHRKFNKTKLKW